MRNKVREFILENFMYGASSTELNDNASLLDTGVMDSTGVMELVSFLEQEFGVTVEDEELIPDNLDSVTKLVRFLERKSAGSVATE